MLEISAILFFLRNNYRQITQYHPWSTSHDDSIQPSHNQKLGKVSGMSSKKNKGVKHKYQLAETETHATHAYAQSHSDEDWYSDPKVTIQYLHRHYLRTARATSGNVKKLHYTIWRFITKPNISDLQSTCLTALENELIQGRKPTTEAVEPRYHH